MNIHEDRSSFSMTKFSLLLRTSQQNIRCLSVTSRSDGRSGIPAVWRTMQSADCKTPGKSESFCGWNGMTTTWLALWTIPLSECARICVSRVVCLCVYVSGLLVLKMMGPIFKPQTAINVNCEPKFNLNLTRANGSLKSQISGLWAKSFSATSIFWCLIHSNPASLLLIIISSSWACLKIQKYLDDSAFHVNMAAKSNIPHIQTHRSKTLYNSVGFGYPIISPFVVGLLWFIASPSIWNLSKSTIYRWFSGSH